MPQEIAWHVPLKGHWDNTSQRLSVLCSRKKDPYGFALSALLLSSCPEELPCTYHERALGQEACAENSDACFIASEYAAFMKTWSTRGKIHRRKNSANCRW